MVVKHTFEDGSHANFLIIDNPTARLGAADWSSVCSVIVQGSTWQFKDWPYQKLIKTAYNMKLVEVARGAPILTEGLRVNSLYVVRTLSLIHI